MNNPVRIFLSYAHTDKQKVVYIYRRLADEGYRPWMDIEDLLPGEHFRLAIEKSICNSDFFMFCLSKNSIDRRGFLQRELKLALDIWIEKLESDIYIIPVRLEDVRLPDSLCKFQWVDLFMPDGWIRLRRSLQEGLKRKAE